MEQKPLQENQDLSLNIPQDNISSVQPFSASESVLLSHPLFLHEQDPLLSILINAIRSVINKSSNGTVLKALGSKWLGQLMRNIFSNTKIPSLKEELKNLGLSFDITCGKMIGNNEIYFRCLDCDKFKDVSPNIYALLCSQCFENSNHAHHRVIMVKKDPNCSATCDCGDRSAFNPDGFCTNHKPKEFCAQEALNKFPSDFLERCLNFLKNAFYGIICVFEISHAATDNRIKNLLSALAQSTLEATLTFCGICYNEINEVFLVVFGELFKSPLSPGKDHVWHFCEDITADKGVKAVDPTRAHPCTCSIAGNLLRIGNLPDHEAQTKLQRLLIECAKELNFKSFLTQEFTKYIHFLYSETYLKNEREDDSNSRLLNMKVQLYGTEELCLNVLNSGYIQNLINVMKRVVSNANQVTLEMYHVASDIRTALTAFINSQSKVTSYILQDHNLISQVLEILKKFQMKYSYPEKFHIGLFDHNINYHCVNTGLMIEKVVSQVVEQGLKVISTYSNHPKSLLLQRLAFKWYECFKSTRSVQDATSFHPALERILISLIRALTDELTETSISESFSIGFPDVNISRLGEQIIAGPLRSLGMIRYTHLEHNFNSGKIWHVYYFMSNLFFEKDILSIQTMLSVIEPINLFETLITNFFSYSPDLQVFFTNVEALTEKDDRFKQKIMVLGDFLHFLVYIMNDETCYLNIRVSKDVELGSEEIELSSRQSRVVEKVLINLLLGHYWVNVPQLKKTMNDVLISHSHVDTILQKIAVFDDKNKKARIKEEYQNEFDPYIFYRNPALQSDTTQNIISKAKKEQQIDLISGKFYTDLPCYLKKVQRNIFQSSLPNHLSSFIKYFPSYMSLLVRPILKLILLNLQVVEDQRDVGIEALLAKVKENYLNQTLMNKLIELYQMPEFDDCKLCIQKIQKLIEKFFEKPQNSTNLTNDTNDEIKQEDQAALKKKLAQQRMLQLKEEFAKKQKIFANKHTPTKELNNEKVEESCEEGQKTDGENELTCQYCLDKINRNYDNYGFPAYIGLTNNLYNVEESTIIFKKEDNPEKLQGDWWPVVSSCMHHYHEKCFQSHYQNSRKVTNTTTKLFTHKFETYCSLCNAACNIFIKENDTNINQVPDQEGNQEERAYPTFLENLENIMNTFREKLRLTTNRGTLEETSIQVEQILKRGYTYFLETFYLIEKTHNLEKVCLLYQLFIKECLRSMKEKEIELKTVPFLLDVILNSNLNSDLSIHEKVLSFTQHKMETLLTDTSLVHIIHSVKKSTDNQQLNVSHGLNNILKEYIAMKLLQILLLSDNSDAITVENIFLLYKEDKQTRDNINKALHFPVLKFILTTYIGSSIANNLGKPNTDVIEALINHKECIDQSLDNLIKAVGFAESFEIIICESMNILITQPTDVIKSLNSMLAHKIEDFYRNKLQCVKLAPRMISLPKTYRDFTTLYFKKKCGTCQEYSQQMSTYICLICGELICLAYCETLQQKRGNLNTHAKQYHLGSSLYLEIQRLNKVVVAFSKNSLFEGKNIYSDQLGQSFQDLVKDPRCPLYSLDFTKFVLNEESVQSLKQIIQQCDMPREAYKIARESGYYYVEGNF